MPRKELEAYLKRKNISYVHSFAPPPGAFLYADLVKIGEEKPPWFCNRLDIFIAFEFEAVEFHDVKRYIYELPSDKLTKVFLLPRLGSCL